MQLEFGSQFGSISIIGQLLVGFSEDEIQQEVDLTAPND